MTSGSWNTKWIRGERVTESAWIGTNVLAWCSGTNIIFYDTVKKTQMIQQCSSQISGDGACCISGHPYLNVFAYTEKSFKPKIFVRSYPSMDKIAECWKGYKYCYLATAFAGDNHLLSLSFFTSFLLTVWNWRTGEKLTSARSSITDSECFSQCLRVSNKKPNFVAQMGWISGCVNIWKMFQDKQTVVLTQNQVHLPENSFAQGISWSPYEKNHVLAITDRDGHVYLWDQYGSGVNRIVLSQRCGECTEIEPAAICWYNQGIVLKTTFCQIRFYKKDASKQWRQEWKIKSSLKPCVLTSVPTEDNRLFYFTREGYLKRICLVPGQVEPNDDLVLDYGLKIEQIDLVYPWGHHLVMLDNLNQVIVVDSYSGVVTQKIDQVEGNIVCLRSHLEYPLIVMTSNKGEICLISMLNPKQPRTIMHNFLQSTELDLIKFTQCGRYILVASKSNGVCYCIDLFHQGTIKIMTKFTTDLEIVDVIFYTEMSTPKLAILFRSEANKVVGKILSFYEFNEKTNSFNDTGNRMELSFHYESLHLLHEKNLEVLGSPYLTRFFCKLDITDQNNEKMIDAVLTYHQVRLAKIFMDKNWITSSAFDGCSIIRKASDMNAVTILKHHHRKDRGPKKVVMNSSGNLSASLGHDGSVVALILSQESIGKHVLKDAKLKLKISQDYQSVNDSVVQMLNSRFELFKNDNNETISWSDWIELQQEKEDSVTFQTEKMALMNDLQILQEKIKNMIDENEKYPEAEQLSLSKFELDWLKHAQKMKIAGDEQENTRLELEAKCEAYQQVTLWMKNHFWNSQTVLAKSIFSMFGDLEVTNYALYDYNIEPTESFEYCKFLRNLDSDAVCPFRSYTTDKLSLASIKQVKMSKIDIDTTTGVGADLLVSENQSFFKGTTTHNFVDESFLYPQFETYSYAQTFINSVMIAQDCKNLRLHFNGLFDKICEIKERELKLAQDRIDQMIKINSELKLMFNQSVSVIPDYPDWKAKEKPESMIVVEDHEVPVKPYLSPSQQNLLQQQAGDAERLRLQMLADDFCDRALMGMMDGVLEVRWEDVIRKDIPVPECMLNKNPEEYSEEEARIVEQYERDVEHLKNEREKYRQILKSRYEKTMGVYKDGVNKFHTRLKNLFQSKMEVQAAIFQLYLLYVREELRHVFRLEYFKNDDLVRQEIEIKRNQITNLTKELKTVTTLIPELHLQKVALIDQAETLDKKFKSKFTSLGKILYKKLETFYKNRPSGTFKDCSYTTLIDLVKVLSGEKQLSYLPQQFYSFSNFLNALDVRSDMIPSKITASLWNDLITFRRKKVQLELKLKAVESQIQEERSVEMYYRKTINECRWAIATLQKQRDKIKSDRTEFDLNVELQLVVKNGQNELSCSSSQNDASNAVFIHRSNIEAINKLVLAAGDKKLFTTGKIVPLRKDILYFEWRHRYLKMLIEDLQEDLHHVKKTTVTKSMQLVLRELNEELNSKPKREIDRKLKWKLVTINLEKSLQFEKTKLKKLELKIQSMEEENRHLEEEAFLILKRTCNCDSWDEIFYEEEGKRLLDLKIKMIMHITKLQRKIKQNEIEIQSNLEKLQKSEQGNCSCEIIDNIITEI